MIFVNCYLPTVSILKRGVFLIIMYERKLINLNQVQIFGWEEAKSLDVVWSLVRGFDLGDQIPPVRLVKVTNTLYEIADAQKYDLPEEHKGGGHTRTLATIHRHQCFLDAIIVGETTSLRVDAININDVLCIPDNEIGENDLYKTPDGRLLWIKTLKTKKVKDPIYR